MNRSPCSDCPWHNCQDDGMHLMLCHKSRPAEGLEIICAGYALVVGFESIALRLAAMSGRYRPQDYSAEGVELHPSFPAMLRAQGIRPPARNRSPWEGGRR